VLRRQIRTARYFQCQARIKRIRALETSTIRRKITGDDSPTNDSSRPSRIGRRRFHPKSFTCGLQDHRRSWPLLRRRSASSSTSRSWTISSSDGDPKQKDQYDTLRRAGSTLSAWPSRSYHPSQIKIILPLYSSNLSSLISVVK
jgi:hypothetical protein